jgi:hypothetical protein
MPKFTKGMPSPNRSGRPKGSATAARLREAIAGQLSDIIDVLVKQSLNGCTASAKLLLDRALPALKPTSTGIILDTIPGDNLAVTGQLILDEISRGNIPVSEGSMLISALGTQARIVEVTELMARIEKLETGGVNA